MDTYKIPKLIKINSKTETNTNLKWDDVLIKINQEFNNIDAFVLMHEADKVSIGYYSNNEMSFLNSKIEKQELINKIRIFNDSKEIYVVKNGDGFNIRVKEDGMGNLENVYEEYDALWGKRIEKVNGAWSRLMEDKISELDVPFIVKGKNVFYKVRNYYKFDEEDGFVKFIDARLCGFYDEEFNSLKVGEN